MSSEIAVGTLFIFSGLIKLNDPVGFAFKLEEYFGQTVLDLPILEPYALVIAVFVVVFEVLLGVFLLLGYQVKFTMFNLLGMIVFFTFLTFYSAYFNKVTDCGCFGDAIKLTPWESFTKDVILLILIVWLFIKQRLIAPYFSGCDQFNCSFDQHDCFYECGLLCFDAFTDFRFSTLQSSIKYC